MSSTDKRQNIVVVGGGGAGAFAAKNLSAKLNPAKYNLILITPRPYYLHLTGCIRMLVTSKGRFEDRNIIPLDKIFTNKNGTLQIGTVVSISDEGDRGGHVTLADGKTIEYSVLVLATGSIWDGPLAIPDGKSEIEQWTKEWRARIEKAEDILLVGGGAVGVEFAGEIKHFYPNKKITVVHKDLFLLNLAYPWRWRKSVAKRLRRKGVNVITSDTVPPEALAGDSTNIETENGKSLTADLIISARGPVPNSSFIGTSLGEDTLDSQGYVKVIRTFQLPSHPRIFAAGDVNDWPEQKQSGKYYAQADIVTENILSLLAGRKLTKEYRGSFEIIILSLGEDGGSSFFGVGGGPRFGDWVTSTLKSKDLFVGKVRRKLGY